MARVKLLVYGHLSGHTGYTADNVLTLFRQMEEAVVDVPAEAYHLVLRIVATNVKGGAQANMSTCGEEPINTVLDLLENMSLRGIRRFPIPQSRAWPRH